MTFATPGKTWVYIYIEPPKSQPLFYSKRKCFGVRNGAFFSESVFSNNII